MKTLFLWIPLVATSIAQPQTLLADLPQTGAFGPAGDFDGDGYGDFFVGRTIYSGLDQSVLFSTSIGNFEADDGTTVLDDWDGDGVPDMAA